VLSVIPGVAEGSSMNFAKSQSAAIAKSGAVVREHYLLARIHPIKVLEEAKTLRAVIREFQPDVIHAHYGTMTAFLCAVTSSLPLVVHFRGSDLNPCPSISKAQSVGGRFLSQIAVLRASEIICVSEELKRRLWWRRGRVTLLTSGVDSTIFYPRPKAEARAELGWPQDERIVLFNGRNPEIKRLDRAEAAIEAARGMDRPIRFEVLHGQTSPQQIATMMCASDCLLFTSDFEGSPNIIKEALACNLPIVSVDVGDVSDRLAGISPSRIVEKDPEALGAAVVEVLAQGGRSNGVDSIQDMTLAKQTERILGLYRRCARKGGARGE
jgi:glycosyltransferase involved in cell wall biosynthesis